MTTINQLSTVSTLAGGDQLAVYNTANGDTRKASMTAVTAYVAANLGDAAGTSLTASSHVTVTGCTVANLPAAATHAGARATVTDATQALTAGIGATVTGGGANIVPVFSNGTNWIIG